MAIIWGYMNKKILSKVPTFLSTLVCPVIGQLMQRRWAAGALFCVGFLATFVWFMVLAARIIISYYKLGMNFESTAEIEVISATTLLPAFGYAMLIYLINVFDVVIAQNRIKQAEREKALLEDLPPELP